MRRMTVLSGLLIVAFAAAAALPALAADDDKVMGVYEGAFDGGGWDGKTIRAQVRAESKFAQVAVIKIGDGKQEVRVEVPGKGREGRFTFTGAVDLGALGGKAEVSGKIASETFTGTIKTKKEAAFTLKRTFPEPPTRGMAAPEGAVALYDGTNLDQHWNLIPHWCPQPDGSVQICNTNLQTKEEFGSGLYHIEFMTPFMPEERGQGRGNSGCYILGRYEVQVLDSFGKPLDPHNMGGIYSRIAPSAAAEKPAGEWQTMDITLADRHVTVILNGVKILDNIPLAGCTGGALWADEFRPGPLYLQGDHTGVQYRNLVLRPVVK